MKKLLAVLATCLVVGCGSSSPSSVISSYPAATLATQDDAKNWASTSAPAMYFYGTILAAAPLLVDGGCPTVTDDGTTAKAVGNGCTDSNGMKWTGSMTFARTAAGAQTGSYTFSDLGEEGIEHCADGGTGTGKVLINGTVTIAGTSSDFTFTMDLKSEGSGYNSKTCDTTALTQATSYSGHAVGGNDAPTTWNGSGKIGTSTEGAVSIATTDEHIDSSVCASEAASGKTTVTAGSNTIVYTYDGATKCDSSGSVKWSLNGADKGEITGVNCSAMPGPAMLAAAALALLLRRRRS